MKHIFITALFICITVSVSAQTRKCGKCGQAIPYAKVTDHHKTCKPKPLTPTTKVCAQCRQGKALSSFSGKGSICNTCVQQNNRRAEAERQEKENKRKAIIAKVKADMVYVEGGTFMMGALPNDKEADSDETPRHQVTLSSFYIGRYEVTQELWQAVMGSNPSRFKGDLQRPVEQVSWNECQTFINKLNALTGEQFRLPTEAEWEYAARGGQKSRGYLYSGSNNISDVAWYWENSNKTTHPVGQKQPNELGLYDMSGNVYEWCQDWYGSYSSSAQTNPTGPSSASGRVYRGGSWICYAGNCRASNRYFNTPVGSGSILGLRLAR